MSLETLTTQTTASTEIPRAPPGTYTPWQVADGMSVALAGALAAMAALVAVINGVRGWFRKGPTAEEIATLRGDIAALQLLCTNFKTKPELAEDAQNLRADLDHEVAARKADGAASAGKFREHDIKITQMGERIARQDALIEGFGTAVGRIETAINRQTERFDTRFDGLQRLVMEKA